MKGGMFKVGVSLDNGKILKEGEYNINDIYHTAEKTYADDGYAPQDGSMMFYGVKGWVGVTPFPLLISLARGFYNYLVKFAYTR
jgi:hypothetical protein